MLWRIQYNQRCPEWHPQSLPYIADEHGQLVLTLPQFVGHPGEYDERAVKLAETIVAGVNSRDAARAIRMLRAALTKATPTTVVHRDWLAEVLGDLEGE